MKQEITDIARQDQIDKLWKDAQINGGMLAPTGIWERSGHRSFKEMIPAWCGNEKRFDESVIDAEVIGYFMPELPARVLEVGGGYGRLAATIINTYPNQIEYTMVDAVPESLVYAQEYLHGYNCKIIPAWHFEPTEYDLCINIASMQEMNQAQVDYYIQLFNRSTRIGGIIFLANSRDFTGNKSFVYPDNWELIYKARWHRSRSPHQPVEVFCKQAHLIPGHNDALELAYYKDLATRYEDQWNKLKAIRGELSATRRKLARTQKALWHRSPTYYLGVLLRLIRKKNKVRE